MTSTAVVLFDTEQYSTCENAKDRQVFRGMLTWETERNLTVVLPLAALLAQDGHVIYSKGQNEPDQ